MGALRAVRGPRRTVRKHVFKETLKDERKACAWETANTESWPRWGEREGMGSERGLRGRLEGILNSEEFEIQSVLIIHGVHKCSSTHSLKFTGNPCVAVTALSQAFADTHGVADHPSCPTGTRCRARRHSARPSQLSCREHVSFSRQPGPHYLEVCALCQ